MEEVLVTAQKREQSLQDVPASVAAISEELLEKTVTNNFGDLTNITSGINIQAGADGFGNNMRIRGAGTNAFVPAIRPSLGIFLNEIPLGAVEMAFNNLADIERIEILKGPQATLFGKAVTAGAIALVTRKPTTEGVDGYVEGNFGNLGLYEYRGGFNVPITGQAAVRVSGYLNERDQTVKNSVRPNIPGGGYEQQGGRIHLLWERDSFSAILGYEEHNTEVYGSGQITVEYGHLYSNPVMLALNPDADPVPQNPDPFRRVTDNSDPTDRFNDTAMWSLHVNWDINEHWSMTSITSKQDFTFETRGFNEDGTSDTSVGPFRVHDFINRPSTDLFSQELRFNFDNGKWSSIVGAFYADTDTVSYTPFTNQSGDLPVPVPLAAVNGAINGPTADGFGDGATQVRDGITQAQAGLELINQGLANPQLPSGDNPQRAMLEAQKAATEERIAQLEMQAMGLEASEMALRTFRIPDSATAPCSAFFSPSPGNCVGFPVALRAAGLSYITDDFEEWAIFTHNIYGITEGLDLTFGLRYTEVEKTAQKGQPAGDVGPLAHLNSLLYSNNDGVLDAYNPGLRPTATGMLPEALVPVVYQTLHGVGAGAAANPATVAGYLATDVWHDDIPIQQDTWDNFSGTVKLTYQLNEDVAFYGGWDRGFKAGGHNVCKRRTDPMTGRGNAGLDAFCPPAFDSEISDNFEVGMKGRFHDRTLSWDISIFYQLFDEFQVEIADEVGIGNSVRNAAEAEIQGFESDFVWLASDHLTLSGNVAWIEAKWDTYTNAGCTRIQYEVAACGADEIQDLSGEPLNYHPEWSYNLFATWAGDFPNGMGYYLRGEVSYRDAIHFFPDGDPDIAEDSYVLYNASIGLNYGNWDIILWGKNLTDEDYLAQAARNRDHSQILPASRNREGWRATPGLERTYGLTLKYRFE